MMTTAQEFERRRWIALALLCFAQFIVVLDASIVNVALPSIGEGLDFSQENLAWVVNAYVLTFGGFLLLGGRMADLLGRRRVFISGLLLVAAASLAAGFAATEGQLIAARAAQGLGAAIISPGGAVDRHHHLPRRRRAQQGAGRLGRGRRSGWRRRRAPRGDPHGRPRLGVGAVGERAGGARGRRALPAADRREPLRVRDAPLRRRRRGDRHRRPLDPRLRDRRRDRRGLGLAADARLDRPLRGADRGLHRDRATLASAADAVPDLPPPDPDRRQRRRAPRRRVAVLDVLLHHALHAAGARLQRDRGGARLPAAGGVDHHRLRGSPRSS